ncbi:MAG TPA: ATP-binding protein [Solirubrobacterales bacterium]|nr:ATP-binding protein [Solirubrobacterales bacterium]
MAQTSHIAAAEDSLGPLTEIAVTGLFGDRDFTLPLDPRLTVLTGENGSGKSTLLKAIRLLAEEHWEDLFKLPLTSLRLAFADGLTLEAESSAHALSVRSGGKEWIFDAEAAESIDPRVLFELRRARREPGQDRVLRGSGMWRGELLYGRNIDQEQVAHLVAPEWLSELAPRFHTQLISARRLEHRLRPDPSTRGEEMPVPVVDQFASELQELMKTHLSRYAANSRRQEKNLPTQIVEAMQGPTQDPEVLLKEVEELRSEVRDLAAALARVGLFQEEEPDQFADQQYETNNAQILLAVREVYLVAKGRFEQLTKLRSDLELFSSFLNERFSNKHIELNQQVGIAVELDSGERIAPSQLSSGEQQLLALAYELLFGSVPGTLVLLDEPELSLHVAWLQGLLGAFLDMGDGRNLQFVIATHSPSVLRGHLDRERSLDLASI